MMRPNPDVAFAMSFALLSSTRYDPFLKNLKWNNNNDGSGSSFLLLSYHLDRLRVAAKKHSWPDAVKALSWHALRSECSRVIQEFPEHERPAACKVRWQLHVVNV
jgi:4-amino-4-deoxychorismate lyase